MEKQVPFFQQGSFLSLRSPSSFVSECWDHRVVQQRLVGSVSHLHSTSRNPQITAHPLTRCPRQKLGLKCINGSQCIYFIRPGHTESSCRFGEWNVSALHSPPSLASHSRGKVIIREPELEPSSVSWASVLLQKKSIGWVVRVSCPGPWDQSPTGSPSRPPWSLFREEGGVRKVTKAPLGCSKAEAHICFSQIKHLKCTNAK